jgi:hypothetical protein
MVKIPTPATTKPLTTTIKIPTPATTKPLTTVVAKMLMRRILVCWNFLLFV